MLYYLLKVIFMVILIRKDLLVSITINNLKMNNSQIQTSIESFVQEVLPSIIRPGEDTLAVFSTYRSIDGHESGGMVRNIGNLRTIMVQGKTGAEEEAMGIAATYNAYDGDAEQHEIYGNQQIKNQQVLATVEPRGTQHQLFIAYAGLSNFDQCLGCIIDYKENTAPDATVIVCTCDCRINEKMRSFEALTKKGIIDYLVISPYCTGRRELGMIADKLIHEWDLLL